MVKPEVRIVQGVDSGARKSGAEKEKKRRVYHTILSLPRADAHVACALRVGGSTCVHLPCRAARIADTPPMKPESTLGEHAMDVGQKAETP